MRDPSQLPPTGQFLSIEEAAKTLSLGSKVLRQGIARGLIPIRQDNTGAIRIHLDDVPGDLQQRIKQADIQPELQVIALSDEVSNLEKVNADAELTRSRLENLVIQQGSALSRYAAVVDSSNSGQHHASEGVELRLAQRDAEVQQLTQLLDRTYKAMEARDQQVANQSSQLTGTTDKAFSLLERAVREGEITAAQLNSLHREVSSSANTTARLEQELNERNSVINNQHDLMERMVSLAEQTASGSTASDSTSTTKRRKRSFWQRLWGGGKGI